MLQATCINMVQLHSKVCQCHNIHVRNTRRCVIINSPLHFVTSHVVVCLLLTAHCWENGRWHQQPHMPNSPGGLPAELSTSTYSTQCTSTVLWQVHNYTSLRVLSLWEYIYTVLFTTKALPRWCTAAQTTIPSVCYGNTGRPAVNHVTQSVQPAYTKQACTL